MPPFGYNTIICLIIRPEAGSGAFWVPEFARNCEEFQHVNRIEKSMTTHFDSGPKRKRTSIQWSRLSAKNWLGLSDGNIMHDLYQQIYDRLDFSKTISRVLMARQSERKRPAASMMRIGTPHE
jgi:hypothetical protein